MSLLIFLAIFSYFSNIYTCSFLIFLRNCQLLYPERLGVGLGKAQPKCSGTDIDKSPYKA